MVLKHERKIVALIIALFLFLALGFTIGPIFEGPDEIEHYRYIRFLAVHHQLPDPAGQFRGQFHQAPLYYLLTMPVLMVIDDHDFDEIAHRTNPYYGYQFSIPGNDNKNTYLHTKAESFPYDNSPTALAVHIIRLFSIVCGVGTVIVSYLIFRELWPHKPALRIFALGIVAFWPQFIYMSSVINNDNLVFLFATIALWLLLRRDFSRRAATQLGVVLGLALLSKSSAAVMALPVAIAILMNRPFWRHIPLIMALVLVIAGWWYLRNLILYEDPTGIQAMFTSWKGEVIVPNGIDLEIGLERAPYGYQTVWARFGAGAIAVAPYFYKFWEILLIVAGIGLVLRIIFALSAARFVGFYPSLIVGLFAIIWVIALVYSSSIAWSGNQGRYLLPGVAAWSIFIALGIHAWMPHRLEVLGSLLGNLTLGVVATMILFGYFRPAYYVSSVPEKIDRRLFIQYGDVAELVGIAPSHPHGYPGDVIEITLYWKALRSTDTNYISFLHAADPLVGIRRDSYPGTGNFLSLDWEAGDRWAEHLLVTIPASLEPQRVYPLIAGLYDPTTDYTVPATDLDGHSVVPIIGSLTVHRSETTDERPDYEFGGVIGLKSPLLHEYEDNLEVCLHWLSLATTEEDYQVFVHVFNLANELVAQADHQPKHGEYPTGAWHPGESIQYCIPIQKPVESEAWSISIGLYRLQDVARVPVKNQKGQTLENAAVVIYP